MKIFEMELDRIFTADFEAFGEKAKTRQMVKLIFMFPYAGLIGKIEHFYSQENWKTPLLA